MNKNKNLLEWTDNGVEKLHEKFPVLQYISEKIGIPFINTRHQINNSINGILDYSKMEKEEMEKSILEVAQYLPEKYKSRFLKGLFTLPGAMLIGCSESDSESNSMDEIFAEEIAKESSKTIPSPPNQSAEEFFEGGTIEQLYNEALSNEPLKTILETGESALTIGFKEALILGVLYWSGYIKGKSEPAGANEKEKWGIDNALTFAPVGFGGQVMIFGGSIFLLDASVSWDTFLNSGYASATLGAVYGLGYAINQKIKKV